MDENPHFSLKKQLADSLNEDELQDLCLWLGVDYENLEGITKNAKARALVRRAEREGKVALIETGYEVIRAHQSLVSPAQIQRTAARIRQNPWLFLSALTLFVAALWFTGWLLGLAVNRSLCVLWHAGNPCPALGAMVARLRSEGWSMGLAVDNEVTSMETLLAVALGGLLGGGLGGAVTTFGLRVTQPALHPRYMLTIATGWAIAWAVGYTVDTAIVLAWNVQEFTNTFLAWMLAAVIGIETLRLTLRWVNVVVDAVQIGLSWMGWLLGWGVGYYIRSVFGNDFGWALSWFIGGGLTFLAFSAWFHQLLQYLRQEA